jgi:hypothetical protein
MPDIQPTMTPEEAYEKLSSLSRLAATKLPIPRNQKFSRSDVVNSFASAFTMIGGTPRLALWANENPGEFYKLFGKLLPSTTMSEIVHRKEDGNLRTYTTEELEEMLAQSSANVIEMSEFSVRNYVFDQD